MPEIWQQDRQGGRNVDDQADWLDDSTVLYAIRAADAGTAALDTYVVPADGGGVPRLLVPNAYSLVALADSRRLRDRSSRCRSRARGRTRPSRLHSPPLL